MDNLTQNLISMLTGVVISLIGVFAVRRKTMAETDRLASSEWRKLYRVSKKEMASLKEEMQDLKCRFNALSLEFSQVKDHRDILQQELDEVKASIAKE